MASIKSKPRKTDPEDKSEPTKITLKMQIITVVGGITIAAIGAFATIKGAQIQSGGDTSTSAPTVTSLNTVVNTDTPTSTTLVQRIDFVYQDSPTKHGWKMIGAKEEELDIEHTFDQIAGNAISISSPVKYGMDFTVGLRAAQHGKVVEFVANLTEDAALFAYVSLVRDDGSTTKGWLKLTTRKGPPKRVKNDEWQLSIEQVSTKSDDWLLYQIDLQDAIIQTFGNDGWKFQQLEKFRIRGKISLAYIAVFGTQ